MDILSTNIQQLPISILEEIISNLNKYEQLVLTNVNRYLNLITAPILYKDIIYHHYFDLDALMNKEIEVRLQELEVGISRIDINDILDFGVIQAEIKNYLSKELIPIKYEKYPKKLWSELKSAIKKYHKFIVESQCIDSNNLIVELESYGNLKRYKPDVFMQQGIEQLKRYKGEKFKLMEMLDLYVEPSLNYEVEDFFHHFTYLKKLWIHSELFHNNLIKFSGFSSDILVYLSIFSPKQVSTDILYIVHRNFKNLIHLEFNFEEMDWDPSPTKLPIFKNLLYFFFTVPNYLDLEILRYVHNAEFWPKLKVFRSICGSPYRTGIYEGQWINLTTLEASNMDPINFNQWNNFNQLKVLHLHLHYKTDSKTLQTIFTNLTNITTLTLQGRFSSQLFNFIPQIHLLKLRIFDLFNFSQPFINFLKGLVTIRTLQLCFTEYAFYEINLNTLLKEKYKFPKLRYVSLDKLPQQLQQWFFYSLNR